MEMKVTSKPKKRNAMVARVSFKGKFDLLYLPLDFENKCNLGYAFINLISSLHIPMFYELFQNQKWQKYKSEKQCDLKYAKYQGKKELASHYEKNAALNIDVIITYK